MLRAVYDDGDDSLYDSLQLESSTEGQTNTSTSSSSSENLEVYRISHSGSTSEEKVDFLSEFSKEERNATTSRLSDDEDSVPRLRSRNLDPQDHDADLEPETDAETELEFDGDAEAEAESAFELGGDDEVDEEEEEEAFRVQRLLEPGDKIKHTFNCGLVEGMDKTDGLFIICTNNLYIINEYKLTPEGEIIEVVPPPSQWEQYHSIKRDSAKHKCQRWSYDDIKRLAKRMYLLCHNALEIFSKDGRNFLVVFDKTERETIIEKLNEELSDSVETIETGNHSAISTVNPINLLRMMKPRNTKKLDSITQKWLEGKTSNFGYLMQLNTFAGRSYNDLTDRKSVV